MYWPELAKYLDTVYIICLTHPPISLNANLECYISVRACQLVCNCVFLLVVFLLLGLVNYFTRSIICTYRIACLLCWSGLTQYLVGRHNH
jgi:hypothetical protein